MDVTASATSEFSAITAQRTAEPWPNTGRLTAHAVVFQGHKRLSLEALELTAPKPSDLVIDVLWSGISTGTERLLWTSEMPPFPGLSYPLVPGYESVGQIISCEDEPALEGQMVFVPGASCYKAASGLFGATASRLVLPRDRAILLGDAAGPDDILLALAATAHHALSRGGAPDLIVGHGVLGRLLARITIALGNPPPTVWETVAARHDSLGYTVHHPDADTKRTYSSICDASGNVEAIDRVIAHAARGASITLAGFYADRPSFAFPPAFIKEVSQIGRAHV